MSYKNLISGSVDSKVSKFLDNPFKNIPSITEAIEISKKYKIALHPRYLFYWNELEASEFVSFLEFLKKMKFNYEKDEIFESFIPVNNFKKNFENLGIEHTIKTVPIDKVHSEEEANILVFDKLNTQILLVNLGFDLLKFKENIFDKRINDLIDFSKANLSKSVCDILSENSEIEIRDKGGTYIGARMGRPEKAKMRKQFNDETNSHGLFPIGEGNVTQTRKFGSDEKYEEVTSNRLKNILFALKSGQINENFRIYYCEECNKDSISPKCYVCGNSCSQKYFERYSGIPKENESENTVNYKKLKLNLKDIESHLRSILGKDSPYPKHVKGISATINKHHSTEHIAKAFLRAKNNVYVNKDGSVRYDMIEMGLTHFRAKEIGTSIKKLKELGYNSDIEGKELINDEQLIEIFPQDVILPDCEVSGDELASEFVINTGNFVDELLDKLYKLPKFYNFKNKEDTIGHLLIGLAPHTSAGIVGRIIGYSKTQGCFSHPVWHAAQRRNLDGDENGVMLLLDGLINFSRDYLPDRRGSRTMDVSLVLTSHLYLDQIDDEVHGMDIVDHYPLEFYKMNKEFKSPKDIKIEKVENRISEEDTDSKYLGYKFTHDTCDMNDTILCSSYKSVPSMNEKLDLQLALAKKIRAVDENQVGSFVIDKHFMKDIKGNLRKFSMQTFRCTNCNTKYRRPPLLGKCSKCGNASINFTIHEGSIKKYVDPSFKIVDEYEVDPYIVEVLELANLRIEGVFGKEIEKQKGLNEFFKK